MEGNVDDQKDLEELEVFFLPCFYYPLTEVSGTIQDRRKVSGIWRKRKIDQPSSVEIGTFARCTANFINTSQRLIESGWRDQLKKHCQVGWIKALNTNNIVIPLTQEIIKAKGTEKITIEDLVKDIVPRGKATVPEKVKEEMMEKIAKFLASAW